MTLNIRIKFFMSHVGFHFLAFCFQVHCEWDDWEIGECSKECDAGTRIDTRSPKVMAANGGLECSGLSNVTKICNTHKCPGMRSSNNCEYKSVLIIVIVFEIISC